MGILKNVFSSQQYADCKRISAWKLPTFRAPSTDYEKKLTKKYRKNCISGAIIWTIFFIALAIFIIKKQISYLGIILVGIGVYMLIRAIFDKYLVTEAIVAYKSEREREDTDSEGNHNSHTEYYLTVIVGEVPNKYISSINTSYKLYKQCSANDKVILLKKGRTVRVYLDK